VVGKILIFLVNMKMTMSVIHHPIKLVLDALEYLVIIALQQYMMGPSSQPVTIWIIHLKCVETNLHRVK